MTNLTISERLFESLCATHNVPCRRIPSGTSKTPDYEIILGAQRIVVEIKQLDENDEDKRINRALDATIANYGSSAPTARLRKQIAQGYRQLKSAAREGQQCLLITYNNSGFLNFIDSFTVTTAMFGSFGFGLGLTTARQIAVTSHGFLGGRKVTRNTCKQLSAIGVLNDTRADALSLEVYHNPYAVVPIPPSVIAPLAMSQFRHPEPHSGTFVSWEPLPIEA